MVSRTPKCHLVNAVNRELIFRDSRSTQTGSPHPECQCTNAWLTVTGVEARYTPSAVSGSHMARSNLECSPLAELRALRDSGSSGGQARALPQCFRRRLATSVLVLSETDIVYISQRPDGHHHSETCEMHKLKSSRHMEQSVTSHIAQCMCTTDPTTVRIVRIDDKSQWCFSSRVQASVQWAGVELRCTSGPVRGCSYSDWETMRLRSLE